MEVLVGDFTENDIKNKRDKIAVELKMKETGLKYKNSKIIKRNGNPVALRIQVCDIDTFKI